jgi:hypothetical protein
MSKKTARISITWSDELQRYAESVVEKYGDEMHKAGIPTHTNTTPSGDIAINRSGVIAFALTLLARG